MEISTLKAAFAKGPTIAKVNGEIIARIPKMTLAKATSPREQKAEEINQEVQDASE